MAGRGMAFSNVAINATPYTTLLTTQSYRQLPLFQHSKNSVLIMTGGTGDVAQGDAEATILENMRIYAQNARNAGCDRVIASTIPKWSGAVPITAPQEVVRQALNALIIANAGNPAYWEAACNLDSDARLTNPDNLTYFMDGIHFATAGHEVVKDLMTPILNSILETIQ